MKFEDASDLEQNKHTSYEDCKKHLWYIGCKVGDRLSEFYSCTECGQEWERRLEEVSWEKC